MTEFVLEKKSGWEYYHLPELTAAGIIHGFFTRRSPSSVFDKEEGRAFLDAFSLEDAVALQQEHGQEIHVVDNGDRPDRGDGILLARRGIAGVIKTADCLCVVLTDPAFPMAVIVHAGWRGTLKKITAKALDMMIERGAARQRMIALLGPSIRGCCYEVGPEVCDAFMHEGFPEDVFSRRDDRLFLDLAKANGEFLKDESIRAVHDVGICTYCSGGVFASYRRGARNERQVNFVAIKGR